MDFQTIEDLAAQLCNRSGGDWSKPYTKRNVWRDRAIVLDQLARAPRCWGHLISIDTAGAKAVMRGPV